MFLSHGMDLQLMHGLLFAFSWLFIKQQDAFQFKLTEHALSKLGQ